MAKHRARARERSPSRRLSRPFVSAAILAGTIAFAALAFAALHGDGGPGASAAVSYAAPVRGDANAPVTIDEYGDFQCPSCGAFTRAVEAELVRRYVDTGKAKLVFHHFAWIGPESKRAAEAASCAGAQAAFWPYHDALYANQRGENSGFLTSDTLKRFASQLGLERAAFDRCLDGGVYRAAVDADFQTSLRLGLNSTPTFFIGGQRIVGAQPISVFAAVIDAKIAGR